MLHGHTCLSPASNARTVKQLKRRIHLVAKNAVFLNTRVDMFHSDI